MAKTVKKVTSKPNATSKAKAPATAGAKKTVTSIEDARKNGAASNVTEMKLSHEQVARLAHHFWAERGRQDGHHEDDWYRAEQELRGKAS